MVNEKIADSVLFVGPDCAHPKGGIAQVLSSYKQIVQPFHFISSTVTEGSDLTKIVTYFRCLIKYMSVLPSGKIGIIHIHGASNGSFWRAALLILLGKAMGKKVIYHMHGGGFKVFTAKHPRAVRYIVGKADVLVALSTHWQSYFADEMGYRRVEVIHNIIDRPAMAGTIPTNDGRCRFLFLGLLCKNKGVYDLLDVIRDHQEEWRGKALFLFGGNGEVDLFQNQIQAYGIGDLVEYAGWVSGDQKARLLSQCDVYLLPSYFEGVPISILEAMSYHKPVISTPVGGIPEIVEHDKSGLLVEPGDRASLADSIETLMRSASLRAAMGEEAGRRVVPYLPESVSKDLNRIYRSLSCKESMKLIDIHSGGG